MNEPFPQTFALWMLFFSFCCFLQSSSLSLACLDIWKMWVSNMYTEGARGRRGRRLLFRVLQRRYSCLCQTGTGEYISTIFLSGLIKFYLCCSLYQPAGTLMIPANYHSTPRWTALCVIIQWFTCLTCMPKYASNTGHVTMDCVLKCKAEMNAPSQTPL